MWKILFLHWPQGNTMVHNECWMPVVLMFARWSDGANVNGEIKLKQPHFEGGQVKDTSGSALRHVNLSAISSKFTLHPVSNGNIQQPAPKEGFPPKPHFVCFNWARLWLIAISTRADPDSCLMDICFSLGLNWKGLILLWQCFLLRDHRVLNW